MKIKVTRQFKDKNTKELYSIGRELDLSVGRVNEIIKVRGLIEIQDVQGEEAEPIEPEEQSEKEADLVAPKEAKAAGRRKRSK